ncbi:MAG: TMEM175 family protein [Methanobrevibacter sp.]|uniref:TMEM175 family protein n=1 Tax=Methanobrevibacter TaxID=2172 RepID=UPI0026F2BB2B|nr:TMEM175 family protein [Methanobrevibacter gottschalkii]MCI7427899.1 TMEM175 family protein [Methanobrevibacter sp.]
MIYSINSKYSSMETTRFETFFDAILAIIITILVIKIPQPAAPTIAAILELKTTYIAYLISFLTLYNLWHANHELFQIIDTIENSAVWIYGAMIFVISLIPYFTLWIANNINSIPAETMFGLIFIITHILNRLGIKEIYKSNKYNKKLNKIGFNRHMQSMPLIILAIGFILTYTIFKPGIYISCLISVVLWIVIDIKKRDYNG